MFVLFCPVNISLAVLLMFKNKVYMFVLVVQCGWKPCLKADPLFNVIDFVRTSQVLKNPTGMSCTSGRYTSKQVTGKPEIVLKSIVTFRRTVPELVEPLF